MTNANTSALIATILAAHLPNYVEDMKAIIDRDGMTRIAYAMGMVPGKTMQAQTVAVVAMRDMDDAAMREFGFTEAHITNRPLQQDATRYAWMETLGDDTEAVLDAFFPAAKTELQAHYAKELDVPPELAQLLKDVR
jgi:hypothetical protein